MADFQITLAPVGPEHAPVTALLIYESAPHYFDHLYGSRAAAVRYLSVFSGKRLGWFGYAYATGAFVDGHLVGLELGVDRWQRRVQEPIGEAYDAAYVPPAELPRVREADERLNRFILPMSPGAYFIHNLAVLQDSRSCGIGAALLTHAFARSAEHGYTRVELDVAVTNPAVRFYQRHGIRIARETRVPELERQYGLRGQYRMERSLA